MRRQPAEISINNERWLVSYADFVTLLFAFFVVMYSISQVNESKYRVLSDTLTEIFNEPKRSLEPIQIGELSRSSEVSVIDSKNVNSQNLSTGAFNKSADLPQLADKFTERFSDLIDDEVVQVNSNEYWLQISLNNSVLFPLGSVKPTNSAISVIAEVADLLKGFNNPIQVEGYTDNLPVSSKQYPSNWELSTARAAAVVKMLIEEGIQPNRLAAVGYAEFQPITENESPEGRAQNRRVVLMIARERVQRPRINTVSAIQNILDSSGREGKSTHPTPSNEIDPDTILDSLIDINPGIGVETVLEVQDPPLSSGDEDNDSKTIKPVETKNGGLLFSSDPDLHRNNQ